jgi:hypothetical protein
LFKHYGFVNGNPWNTSVQFNDRTIARDTFSTGSGFRASYHFNIADQFDFSGLKAVVERPELWKVLINGKPVLPEKLSWWLGKEFKVFKIGNFVKQGLNTLTLVADRMSVHAEIEPVYILGNFSLSSSEKGWNITKPAPLKFGSWKMQDMAMYGQDVSYTKKLHLNNRLSQYYVQLNKWEGTVATVLVNNKSVGNIAYPPYTIDITDYVISGDNKVEVRVTGSLKNLLGPFHNNPNPGLVSPWHWRNVKQYPQGKDYNTYDYGLMEDFNIFKSTKVASGR